MRLIAGYLLMACSSFAVADAFNHNISSDIYNLFQGEANMRYERVIGYQMSALGQISVNTATDVVFIASGARFYPQGALSQGFFLGGGIGLLSEPNGFSAFLDLGYQAWLDDLNLSPAIQINEAGAKFQLNLGFAWY